MTAFEVIKKYLEYNGFDGLYNDDNCGCLLEDLVPCDGIQRGCTPGYKMEDITSEYGFCLGPERIKHEKNIG